MRFVEVVVIFGCCCVLGLLGSTFAVVLTALVGNPKGRAAALRGLLFSVLGLGLVGLYAFFR
jgi:hypothetical protein